MDVPEQAYQYFQVSGVQVGMCGVVYIYTALAGKHCCCCDIDMVLYGMHKGSIVYFNSSIVLFTKAK